MKLLFFHLCLLLCLPALGQEMYSGPIIDMHLHAFNEKEHAMFFGMEHPPTLRGETFMAVKTEEALLDETLKRMREHKIVLGVVTAGQHWKQADPDRIIVANSNLPIEELRRLHAEGNLQVMAEMSPFYGGIKADHASQAPYFALAEELGIPVGFHIFPGGPPGGVHMGADMLKKMRVANADPKQLDEVLVKHPGLKLYVMHGGWPYVDDMKALMYAHPNLYVEVGVLNWILTKEELYTYLKSLIDAGFGRRIMYGTDQMSWPQTITMGIETINSADFLSLEQKEDIFYNNAASFLGLSEEQIKKHKGK